MLMISKHKEPHTSTVQRVIKYQLNIFLKIMLDVRQEFQCSFETVMVSQVVCKSNIYFSSLFEGYWRGDYYIYIVK